MRYDTRARIAAGIKLVLERGLRWHRVNDIWHRNDNSHLQLLE